MNKTYLILDLRNNKYAPGLLTLEDGKLDWYANPIFQIFKDSEATVRDSTSVVSLSFLRRRESHVWSPVQLGQQELASIDESRFEFVPSLFDETRERLEGLFPKIIAPLLKRTFNEYEGVSDCWVLVDHEGVGDVFEENFAKLIQKKNIKVAFLSDWGALGGFALAFDGSGSAERLLGEEETWLCGIEDTVKRYRWKGGRFTVESPELLVSAAEASIPRWKTLEELERVGAALLGIFWRDKLVQIVDQQIEGLERQLIVEDRLRKRLREVYERLSSGSPGLGRWPAPAIDGKTP